MAAVVHQQQVGVIVVQDVQRVSLEVVHDVLCGKILLESTQKLYLEIVFVGQDL